MISFPFPLHMKPGDKAARQATRPESTGQGGADPAQPASGAADAMPPASDRTDEASPARKG